MAERNRWLGPGCWLIGLWLACSCGWTQRTPGTTHLAPRSSALVSRYALAPGREPKLTHAAKLALVRRQVKYVFVLFQENRSFDFYFGDYPGADGLDSQSAAATAGFIQPLVDTDGTVTSIRPFRIPVSLLDSAGKSVPLYPWDLASVNHSHTGMVSKLNTDAAGVIRNDRYALTEEGVTLDAEGKPSKFPTLERKQFGELVMGHLDCDTAPFLWRYADRFALFDRFFATEEGPSTPNAIAMISGQVGETQWVLHPDESKGRNGVPVMADPDPHWRVKLDAEEQSRPATDPRSKSRSINLTFASLPLSFMGGGIEKTTAGDSNPAEDLADVQDDIRLIAGHPDPATHWGWYQQGYDHEPTDAEGRASHKNYIAHHNAPAYFGYVSNNPGVEGHLHGLGDFFADVKSHRLPASGVFYVRGGYGNIRGLKPMDPNPKLAAVFNGNDDHPGYSDSAISETLLAEEVNAIARSPYWRHAVILIAYDESDGLYDHAVPNIRANDPQGRPLTPGPRVPFLMIGPFAASHTISHETSEHSSIIRFVDQLFGLIPLADLPDEEKARKLGLEKYGQAHLGPADDGVADVGDLLSGFSNARLLGRKPALPRDYAVIPDAELFAFPHMDGQGCKVMSIHPTDEALPNPVPADFNPRPDTTPGIPAQGGWTP